MYEIETENVYADSYKDKELFNFSNYLEKANYYDNTKILVVGQMKEKTCGVSIKSFAGLKEKVYAYITEDD